MKEFIAIVAALLAYDVIKWSWIKVIVYFKVRKIRREAGVDSRGYPYATRPASSLNPPDHW